MVIQKLNGNKTGLLNLGVDLETFDGKLTFALDLYKREVDGLLFNPVLPGTAGSASAPFVNIASMENRGLDMAIGYRGRGKNFRYSIDLNLTHYRNIINQINDNSDKFFGINGYMGAIGVNNINQVGYPISGFFGYTSDGLFQNQQEVDDHALQDGKQEGRIRFQDISQDGTVNLGDKGYIGNPHPDLILGLNLSLNFKKFDFSAFINSWLGNEIFQLYEILFLS